MPQLYVHPKDSQEFLEMLVDEDIVGLDPRYNLFTPFDVVFGTYTKGYQGARGLYRGGQLVRRGLGRFGSIKILESLTDLYSFGQKSVDMYTHFGKSSGQHRKSGTSVPSVRAKTSGGTKPSRRASPGKTSKPFWSKGKPKCKKGFRYDYKRKLCVKIK